MGRMATDRGAESHTALHPQHLLSAHAAGPQWRAAKGRAGPALGQGLQDRLHGIPAAHGG
jgi:hypothetical protein